MCVGRPGASKQDGSMCRGGMRRRQSVWVSKLGEGKKDGNAKDEGRMRPVCVCVVVLALLAVCVNAKGQRGKDQKSRRTHQSNHSVGAKKREVKSQGRDANDS